MQDGRTRQRRLLLVFIIVSVINLAAEALYIYRTRHYIREFYPAVHSHVQNTVAAMIKPKHRPADKYFDQRLEVFAVLKDRVPFKKVVIFAGDSLTDNFEWATYFSDLKDTLILNRGVRGDTVQGLLSRFDVTFVPQSRPKIFVMIGVNNISETNVCDDLGPDGFLSQYYSLLDRFLYSGIPAHNVFVQSILPVSVESKSNAVIRSCNEQIFQYSRELGINYIDIYSRLADKDGSLDRAYSVDGLHLNAEGYKRWMELIRPYVSASR